MKKVIEGSHAVAEAVRLCAPKVIAAYPITPQTHIVERLSKMVADGELDSEFLCVESEHSAMSACIGAQATGVRTYTATASQGLILMHEMLHVASGMRLPIVINVANRSVSSPLSIWNDWLDAMAVRNSGWVQLFVESSQEALDTTIQAYKIAETIHLPVMVCIDGFYLSHTYEPVDIPDTVAGYLGDYKPKVVLDPKNPITQGMMAGPKAFQEFKEQQHRALLSAKDVIKNENSEFNKKFSRIYGDGLVETYNMESADYAIISMGSVCGTIKHILDEKKISDIGLIRIKTYRPFPNKEIIDLTKNLKALGVLEKDISFGIGGALWADVKTFVDKPVSNFIGGLGGRDIQIEDIVKIFGTIRKEEENIHWVGSQLKK